MIWDIGKVNIHIHSDGIFINSNWKIQSDLISIPWITEWNRILILRYWIRQTFFYIIAIENIFERIIF